MSRGDPAPAFQFAAPEQQRQAASIGMWIFLATELMLFGGVFLSIAYYRVLDREAVREAAGHLDMWLGGLNTGVLLTSSLAMASAVAAARAGRRRPMVVLLWVTALLGLAFLSVKGLEYWKEYHDGLMPHVGPPSPLKLPGAKLYMNIYFTGTALHALHLTIGVVSVVCLALATAYGRIRLPERQIVVENLGLYWHLVDVVWIFLYPGLYLAGR